MRPAPPRIHVTRVLGVSDDVESPILRVGGRELETLEGNPNLQLIAGTRHMPLGLVDVIGAQIRRRPIGYVEASTGCDSIALDHRPIFLDAQWIGGKHEGPLAVVKCVEQDLHIVVGINVVAVGQRGVDCTVRFKCPDAEVDRRW
jgi:hypothetical protein